MDRPRLRPLESFVVEEEGQKLLALRDPSGLTDAIARLPPVAVAVLQLCDGENSRDDICAEFLRRYQSPLRRADLDRLLEQLDPGLFLDSERFRAHSAQVFGAFARSPVREAHHAGRSYPAEPAALAAQLDGFFAAPRGPGLPNGQSNGSPLPRAIIAPHIDFQRGGPAYAWAYRELAATTETPELVVIFGTDHNGAEQPFTLTRKHYETPLGALETDVALVDQLTAAVEARLGGKAAAGLFRDEHHHRGEHSIEFQVVWLRHLLGARAAQVKVLPILCGSLHHFVTARRAPMSHPERDGDLGRRDAAIEAVLEEVVRLTAGRRTLWVAGADLAHVGPRFGDAEPLTVEDRGSLERRDQATLDACARGDARAWFEEIAREEDRRRVCGLSPIYALLHAARPGKGRLAAYGQCPADENGGSLVSIASVVWA